MTKTNYSKVELSLEEGLRKMTVSKLSNLADIATSSTPVNSEKKLSKKQQTILNKIVWGIKRLEKKERKIYEILKFPKEKLQTQLQNPKSLTDAEWKELEHCSHEVKNLIKQYFLEENDEKIIEEQQMANKKKRININDKWLAL